MLTPQNVQTTVFNIIKHVISPSLLTELVNDIGDSVSSIIVDESTENSVLKYLCLCVKYFSKSRNDFITDYLGLIAVECATAGALYEGVQKYLAEIGLPEANMIEIGTDGGSNLCGKNHSLYALFKKSNPKLQLIRCICHSLDNCASKASEEFPATVDFLLR